MLTYESKLDGDLDPALNEGHMHFDRRDPVHHSLHKIASRLTELQIPYAVAALYYRGFRRFTEHVDVLVNPDGLREIHERLEGLGYVAPPQGSKQLRDAVTG